MSEIKRKTHELDAAGVPLGRLASRIALLLTGKGKRSFARHIDGGDFVVVRNVEKMVLTGKKLAQKALRRFSGYPGGLKEIPWAILFEKNPKFMLRRAVEHMLPKNRLRKSMIKRLRLE